MSSESKALSSEDKAASFPGIPADEITYTVKSTDMLPKLLNAAITTARDAFTQSSSPAFVSATLKSAFDSQFGGPWHCIVGANFGSHVVHESRGFVFFVMAGVSVLLFKSGTE